MVESGLVLRKRLHIQAHRLKPVVWLGHQGLTPAVVGEIEIALVAHELIKVKIPRSDRWVRRQIIEDIMQQTSALLIQAVGHIATFYRRQSDVSLYSPEAAQKKR